MSCERIGSSRPVHILSCELLPSHRAVGRLNRSFSVAQDTGARTDGGTDGLDPLHVLVRLPPDPKLHGLEAILDGSAADSATRSSIGKVGLALPLP